MWNEAISDVDIKDGTCVFLSIDDKADLTFQPRPPAARKIKEQLHDLLTPASTPNASGLSPDAQQATGPSGAANGFEQDADSQVIDARDESWILSADLGADDPNVPSDFCCAKQTAYLLKRASARVENALVALAVNIVDGGEANHDPLLNEVLQMLHKLICLARIRNASDDDSVCILPWHVVMARKAYAALDSTMRYDGG